MIVILLFVKLLGLGVDFTFTCNGENHVHSWIIPRPLLDNTTSTLGLYHVHPEPSSSFNLKTRPKMFKNVAELTLKSMSTTNTQCGGAHSKINVNHQHPLTTKNFRKICWHSRRPRFSMQASHSPKNHIVLTPLPQFFWDPNSFWQIFFLTKTKNLKGSKNFQTRFFLDQKYYSDQNFFCTEFFFWPKKYQFTLNYFQNLKFFFDSNIFSDWQFFQTPF